ncbi:16412_t:CDS:1, partial [Acaulospora colombiana]
AFVNIITMSKKAIRNGSAQYDNQILQNQYDDQSEAQLPSLGPVRQPNTPDQYDNRSGAPYAL